MKRYILYVFVLCSVMPLCAASNPEDPGYARSIEDVFATHGARRISMQSTLDLLPNNLGRGHFDPSLQVPNGPMPHVDQNISLPLPKISDKLKRYFDTPELVKELSLKHRGRLFDEIKDFHDQLARYVKNITPQQDGSGRPRSREENLDLLQRTRSIKSLSDLVLSKKKELALIVETLEKEREQKIKELDQLYDMHRVGAIVFGSMSAVAALALIKFFMEWHSIIKEKTRPVADQTHGGQQETLREKMYSLKKRMVISGVIGALSALGCAIEINRKNTALSEQEVLRSLNP